jgi:hypothetical protein
MSFSERIRPLVETDTFDVNRDYFVQFSIHSLQKIEFNGKEIISIDLFGQTFYVVKSSEIIGNDNGDPLLLNFCMDLYIIIENLDRYRSNNYTFYFYVDPNLGNFETASLRVFSKELDRQDDFDIPINKYDLFCAA